MKKTYYYLLIVFSIVMVKPLSAQININDSLTLVDLYNSTNGSGWIDHKYWLTKRPVNTWNGVSVINNRVSKILLPLNNLAGVLPATLGNLDSLQVIFFHNNQLTGKIPDEISKLKNLVELYLDFNQLNGKIPDNLNKLINLTELHLDNNKLTRVKLKACN